MVMAAALTARQPSELQAVSAPPHGRALAEACLGQQGRPWCAQRWGRDTRRVRWRQSDEQGRGRASRAHMTPSEPAYWDEFYEEGARGQTR